ncbi:MAG TPA: hypothetical protein DEQ39_10975 [Atlantibacter hermannii]|nr:hypothetical protein [Atlantibacter hermannii]
MAGKYQMPPRRANIICKFVKHFSFATGKFSLEFTLLSKNSFLKAFKSKRWLHELCGQRQDERNTGSFAKN